MFNSDKWSGKCEVKLNDSSGKVIDCYNDNEFGDDLKFVLEDTNILFNISFSNILVVSMEFIISTTLYLLLFKKKDLILTFTEFVVHKGIINFVALWHVLGKEESD